MPGMIRGKELMQLQQTFAAATAVEQGRGCSTNGVVVLDLTEHVGDFLNLLTWPPMLEILAEIMPTRYEGLPQCVSLAAHIGSCTGVVSSRGWRRDYPRPAKDIILYGPPAPPQHMADDIKVFFTLRELNGAFMY